MTTLSVPLPAYLEKMVERLSKERGSNKAEVVRYALNVLSEKEAVMSVLQAEQEPTLSGDLRKLAKKL